MPSIRGLITALTASLLIGPWAVSSSHAAPAIAEGATCTAPLEMATVTVKKRKTRYICWQQHDSPSAWRWTRFNPRLHPPYALPQAVSWRTVPQPPFSGRSATDPKDAKMVSDRLAQLATEVDYSWIEVDVEGRRTITAAVWKPRDSAKHPVIIDFHGTGGLIFWGYEFAADLARSGYVVVAPAWWGPRPSAVEPFFPSKQMTGLFENPAGPEFTGANIETVRMLLPLIAASTQLTGADPSRIAVQGHSRGGTLALVVASAVPAISVAVSHAAAFLPPQLNGFITMKLSPPGWETLPRDIVHHLRAPTLVVAGMRDERVPVASVRDYETWAGKAKRTNIEFAYLDAGHSMTHSYNQEWAAKTRELTLAFYAAHL